MESCIHTLVYVQTYHSQIHPNLSSVCEREVRLGGRESATAKTAWQGYTTLWSDLQPLLTQI